MIGLDWMYLLILGDRLDVFFFLVSKFFQFLFCDMYVCMYVWYVYACMLRISDCLR